jgi:hypothetical protein
MVLAWGASLLIFLVKTLCTVKGLLTQMAVAGLYFKFLFARPQRGFFEVLVDPDQGSVLQL